MPITSSVKFMFKKEFKAFVLSIEYETAIGKIMRFSCFVWDSYS